MQFGGCFVKDVLHAKVAFEGVVKFGKNSVDGKTRQSCLLHDVVDDLECGFFAPDEGVFIENVLFGLFVDGGSSVFFHIDFAGCGSDGLGYDVFVCEEAV